MARFRDHSMRAWPAVRRMRRVAGVGMASGLVVVAAYVAMLAVALAVIQCDEACETGRFARFHWWKIRDSWQWSVQMLPPFTSLFFACCLARGVWIRESAMALRSAGVMLASYAFWVFMLWPLLTH